MIVAAVSGSQGCLGRFTPGGTPASLQRVASLCGGQRPKLMDKSDAGIELRIPRQALLQPWHSDQDHADFSGVEDCSYLLETGHSEAVRFIDKNERRRVTELHGLDVVFFCNFTCNLIVCRMEF